MTESAARCGPPYGIQDESSVVVRRDLERQVRVARQRVVEAIDDTCEAIVRDSRGDARERAQGHASTVQSTLSGSSATDAPARSVYAPGSTTHWPSQCARRRAGTGIETATVSPASARTTVEPDEPARGAFDGRIGPLGVDLHDLLAGAVAGIGHVTVTA